MTTDLERAARVAFDAWMHREEPMYDCSDEALFSTFLEGYRAALAAEQRGDADVRVKRGGLGGPDAIWLHIGNQGFRIVCEPDEAFPNRVDWYEKQLRAAVAKIATPPPPASAAVGDLSQDADWLLRQMETQDLATLRDIARTYPCKRNGWPDEGRPA